MLAAACPRPGNLAKGDTMADMTGASGPRVDTGPLVRTGADGAGSLASTAQIISSIADPIVIADPSGVLAANPSLLVVLGATSVDDIVERAPTLIRDAAIVDLGSGMELSTRESMASLARMPHDGPWMVEFRRADLEIRATFRATLVPLALPGHPEATLIFLADISELEAALDEARHEAALLALADDAILSLDEGGIIRRWLGGAERSYGWTAQEAVGRSVADLLQPEPSEIMDVIRDALWSTGTWSGRLSVATKSGRRIVMSSRQTLERDQAGRIVAVLAIDRVIEEDTLKREEAERLAAGVIAAAPIGVEVYGPDGTATHINDAMVRLLGLPDASAAIGKFNILTDPLYAGTDLQEAFRRAYAGEVVRLRQVSDHLADGADRWPTRRNTRHLDVIVWPIHGSAGEISAVVALSTDITDRVLEEEERRKVEERIHLAQKLEGLVLLAGGVAHDLNNILAPIVGNAALLEEQFAPGTEGREIAVAIKEAGARGALLARQMMAYAGRASVEAETIDLRSALEATRPLVAAALPKGIETVLELGDVGAVGLDPSQLQQVILNLAINAAEAMGETGVLTIRTGRGTGGAMDARDGASDERVVIEVEDTGSGMSPEACDRIFEPFYSTKGPGRGLGLAAVLGIVRAHDGTISATSRVGAGTTITITLPPARSEDVAVQTLTPWVDIPTAPNATTILVIDDEPAIRRFARLVLERDGHSVLEARDGPSAIDVFTANRSRIGAVLCDLTLPHISGRDVIKAIRALDRAVPVVVMSGWSEDSGPKLDDDRVVGWLQKPFTPADLRARVAEAVVSPRRRAPKRQRAG